MASKSVHYPVTSMDLYGIPEVFWEYANPSLSDHERQTIENKISMISKVNLLQQAIDQIRFRAKGIPVLDDAKHASGVQEMADLVTQASDAIWKAAMHGIL